MINALLLVLALCPCPVKRYPNGRIVRSWTAIRDFKIQSGYPSGRPGYVIDHIIPLCACGPDVVENMQWQRADSSRLKDVLEIRTCNRLSKNIPPAPLWDWSW